MSTAHSLLGIVPRHCSSTKRDCTATAGTQTPWPLRYILSVHQRYLASTQRIPELGTTEHLDPDSNASSNSGPQRIHKLSPIIQHLHHSMQLSPPGAHFQLGLRHLISTAYISEHVSDDLLLEIYSPSSCRNVGVVRRRACQGSASQLNSRSMA